MRVVALLLIPIVTCFLSRFSLLPNTMLGGENGRCSVMGGYERGKTIICVDYMYMY